MAWKNVLDRAALGLFPPELVVQIKAIACELPANYKIPLSRWSTEDIVHYVRQSGLVATISGSTVRMDGATEKRHLIIHLVVIRYPQTFPNSPEGIYDILARFGDGWMYSAAACSQIDHIEAIEA